MDDLVERSIKLVNSKAKTSQPWEFDKPWKQPYHIFSHNDGEWQMVQPGSSTSSHANENAVDRLALYSWNIDFMLPFAESRMEAAVRHLQGLVAKHDRNTASVVYLQECVKSDLKLIAAHEWIRSAFALTDRETENWQSGHYGTITLIDRRLAVKDCFRVHYSQTRMQRDVLITDIFLGKDNKIIRFCNTHLESLALEPPYRPPQIALTAGYMHDPTIHGAAAAGDFNAIQDFDRHLHSDNDLQDAYLMLGGSEDDAKGGHTWGQQAATVQRKRFGTSRMDKVYFCGGLRCLEFQRFGAGVVVEKETERKELVELGFDEPWITDHLGVMAVFEVYQSGGRTERPGGSAL